MQARFCPEDEYFSLLKSWCDGLIRYQIDAPDFPEFDGGIACPSCKTIHGRCHDAIYPMMTVYRRTKDEKYLKSAKKLFAWGENLLCDDGSFYNDAQSAWNGVTVFHAISLHDALTRHGDLLDEETRKAWEARLEKMGDWLFQCITPGAHFHINYLCANACAMALLGKYFRNHEYARLSKELAYTAAERLSENGLLSGEGRQSNAKTAKGCSAIDIGYNVEESLPCLIRYAEASGDEQALGIFEESFRAHLSFMLPDGAWDNSFGTRNFKWTYWGGRTSDGCLEALNFLGKRDPVFAEAGYRNFLLLKRFTSGGLLYGGRDYAAHGEKPCTHHAFCHAKALASVLDEGVCAFERAEIPSDHAECMKYYPELDLWRVSVGDWRADVCAYDFPFMRGGHISGGSISLLWHREYGPVIAAGAVDEILREPNNQQLSLKKSDCRSSAPRVEAVVGNKRCGQHYDGSANVSAKASEGVVSVRVSARLTDDGQNPLPDSACELHYEFTPEKITVSGRVPLSVPGVCYKLPVVSDLATVAVLTGRLGGNPVRMFNLNPGFIGREYTVYPDENGQFSLTIS